MKQSKAIKKLQDQINGKDFDKLIVSLSLQTVESWEPNMIEE